MSPADTHLRRAVRALAGLDDAALDAVTPDAMRAVLRRRGWWKFCDETWFADRSVIAREEWEHDVAQCEKRGRGAMSVMVPVLPDAADTRLRTVEWAEAVASRHGDVAPAEVLAEALAVVAAAEHTGIAASWCPVCGTCTCPRGSWGDREPDAACPLHGDASAHDEGPTEP